MKITVTKNDIDYSLKIESGHFVGTLDNIPENIIKDLKTSLDTVINKEEVGYTTNIVWNPRSGRHEIVKK